MKILVTGGLGFIGSNFILNILEKLPKLKLVNIDAELVGSNKQNLLSIKKNDNYRFIHGDITNEKLVEKVVSKIDIVINFAAESHVDRSISSPFPFIRTNILGIFRLLESVRKHKKKIIQISTDEVFGSLKKGSATENYTLNPSSPYSSSKASAELLVRSYIRTYDIDAIITRCTNNFGPRQDPEKLIPRTVFFAKNNKKIPIYGTRKAVRDWIYVNDHCDAIAEILLNGKWGETYNISSDNKLSNTTVVKKILKLLGKSSKLYYHTEDRPGHDLRYSLDSSKIRNELRWKPKFNFDEALEITIRWYLDHPYIWKNSNDYLKEKPWK